MVFPLNETNLFSLQNAPFSLPITFNDIFLQHTLHHIKQLQRCKPTFMSKVCACVEWGRDPWKQKQTVRHAHLDPILLEGPAASRGSQRDIRLETWVFWFSVPAGPNRQMANQCWGNFSLRITPTPPPPPPPPPPPHVWYFEELYLYYRAQWVFFPKVNLEENCTYSLTKWLVSLP